MSQTIHLAIFDAPGLPDASTTQLCTHPWLASLELPLGWELLGLHPAPQNLATLGWDDAPPTAGCPLCSGPQNLPFVQLLCY
jgi:hypothetical protein